MNAKDLNSDQLEEFESRKTPNEVLELAQSEGAELTKEQLDQIAGGSRFEYWPNCPNCGSDNVCINPIRYNGFRCRRCNTYFE